MKRLICLLTITLSIGFVTQLCWGYSSSELIIPPSARVPGSVSSQDTSANTPPIRNYVSELPSSFKKDANEIYNFSVKSLEGKYTHMGDYKGKVIVVNFWESTCYPSYLELFKIESLANFDKRKEVVIICVAEDDEKLLLHYKDKIPQLSFPIFTYNQFDIPDALEHEYVPTTFIINQNGKIILAESGIIEGFQLWEEIQKLLPHKPNTK